MYLLFDQALVTRSSSSILFFKKDGHDEDDVLGKGRKRWRLYKTFDEMRGQIYFIKGNVRIQVTCEDRVYFFLIDKETFEPTLENVMHNFMKCSQLMFGSRVRYGISYRVNQPGLIIYTRKYYHNFKVCISNQNYEGAVGDNLKYSYAYILALKKKIIISDQTTYQVKQEWEVPTDDDKIEILYLTVSEDEKKVGVTLGKRLIKDGKEIDKLLIYKKDHDGVFQVEQLFKFPFPDACIQFLFDCKNTDELIFFSKE